MSGLQLKIIDYLEIIVFGLQNYNIWAVIIFPWLVSYHKTRINFNLVSVKIQGCIAMEAKYLKIKLENKD